MSEDGVTVPAFYRTLGGTGGPKEFDGSREAWLWEQLMDERDEECIETAARIIEVYKDMGSYPQTGEDFHQLADFMASLRWLSWDGVEELEEFLAGNRPEIQRSVREIHAQRQRKPMNGGRQ